MTAPDTLCDTRPDRGFPATRDDFPYSLQAYATPVAEPGAGAWTLLLYRATDPAERVWLRANGFRLDGRLWVRGAGDAAEETVENG